MHVWIVADVPRSMPGGMRRHMELHAQGLARLGETASLFFSEDLDGVPPLLHRFPGASSLLALGEKARRERPDVVNVHTQCAPAWVNARRSGLLDAKVVVMSYSADEPQIRIRSPRDVLRWGKAALPARHSFPHASGIWCVNQQDVEYYVGTYGVSRSRVARFPHAVADAFYGQGELGREVDRLLFLGSWITRKGVDVLVPALERVVTQAPKVEIVLAGTQSGEARVSASLPASLRARTRIKDVAGDAELRALYQSSTLLLLPSRVEGLPISMLEAMACGCPVLAAANSGMLDVVTPERNGWLEVSFDPETWARRILELLARPEALAAASVAARETAEEFRVEAVARRVAEWYSRLPG